MVDIQLAENVTVHVHSEVTRIRRFEYIGIIGPIAANHMTCTKMKQHVWIMHSSEKKTYFPFVLH